MDMFMNEKAPRQEIQNNVDHNDFWVKEILSASKIPPNDTQWYKKPPLPLARIKKIMRLEEFANYLVNNGREVSKTSNDPCDSFRKNKFLIAGEVPVIFSKACEMMIHDISTRAWQNTVRTGRKAIRYQDILMAVKEENMYDFLVDTMPYPSGDADNKAVDGHMKHSMAAQQRSTKSLEQILPLPESQPQPQSMSYIPSLEYSLLHDYEEKEYNASQQQLQKLLAATINTAETELAQGAQTISESKPASSSRDSNFGSKASSSASNSGCPSSSASGYDNDNNQTS